MWCVTAPNEPVAETVIAEVLADPEPFLDAAANGEPGWSAAYGGPDGVAVITGRLRDHLRDKQRQVASLRAAAVATMLRDRSLAAVGRLLGVGKTAVHKVHQEGIASSAANPFYDLATKERSW